MCRKIKGRIVAGSTVHYVPIWGIRTEHKLEYYWCLDKGGDLFNRINNAMWAKQDYLFEVKGEPASKEDEIPQGEILLITIAQAKEDS